ncbi:MAG TPA: DUF3276 family protein [Bacteroidia bacterium]
MATEENGRFNEEPLYSKSVRAGKRTYFFDVRSTRAGDYYLTITESKKIGVQDDGKPIFQKHKVFLYKEDFEKFTENFHDAIDYIKKNAPVIETTRDSTDSSVSFDDLGK